MIMRRFSYCIMALLLGGTLVPNSGRAADAPPLTAAVDADITYKAALPDTPGTVLLQRLRISVFLQRQRLDLPTSQHWVLVDARAGSMSVVSDTEKTVITTALDSGTGKLSLQPGQSWVRVGGATIADSPCVIWQARAKDGNGPSYCVTSDGLVLKTENWGRVISEAIEVSRARQSAAVFSLPSEYSAE